MPAFARKLKLALHRELKLVLHQIRFSACFALTVSCSISSRNQILRFRTRQTSMCHDRRDFLRRSAGLAGAALLGSQSIYAESVDYGGPEAAEAPGAIQQREVPESIRNLRRMTDGVVPISMEERKARIAKAQRLMAEHKIDAIYIEPGSTMFYFTGMRWGTSERMFALVIPANG